MLLEPVYMYKGPFIKGPCPTVPSAKMADALATDITNYKFQFNSL